MLGQLGKMFFFLGLFIMLVGVFLIFHSKFPFLSKIGNLPGDIVYKKENFSFYFPLTTSLLVSLILTLILKIFSKN